MECPDLDVIDAFVAGDLAHDGLVEHLGECASCRRASAAFIRSRAGESADTPTLIRSGSEFEGAAVDRYVLEAVIGAGGMGIVFRAHDPVLDRNVAIKIIDGRGLSSLRRERLLREARTMARIAHANVVPVHDAGIVDDDVFVTMALIDGTNLRVWLARGPTAERRLDVCVGVVRGVAAAHRAGVVHSDIKPDNVLVSVDDTALVGDFGLARRVDRVRAEDAGGTYGYMAPEVERGEAATPASDQYSLAVTIHECLTGARPPRQGEPSTGIPRKLRGMLAKALDLDPARRLPDLAPLVECLVAASHTGWRRRSPK